MDVDPAQVSEFAKIDGHQLDMARCTSFGSLGSSNDIVRIASSGNLEKGSSRFDKNNSVAFGDQEWPSHHVDVFKDALDHFSFDSQTQERSKEADLEEAGHKFGQGCIFQSSPGRSIHLQPTHAGTTDGLQKQRGLDKRGSRTGAKSRLETIILEQSWVSIYKRLFLSTIILNFAALTLAGSGHFPYAKSKAMLFSLGNIVMCVLVRNEVFLRVLYWVAVHLLGYWWVPLKLKTMMTALLQSLGGIHSGCGLGAVMWLAYALFQTIRNLENTSGVMVAVPVGILSLLLMSSLAAFPILRHIHHNIFESVHRFAGWSSLGLVWIYVVLDSFWVPATKSFNISNRSRQELVKMESLWLTAATTIMLILPWLSVRRVAVEAVVPPSKSNTLLHFKGAVKPGLLARISPSPFSEWHAFGIISDGRERHTVVAGAVGDFTASLVEHPPTHIWIRTFYFAGLPYLTNLYERVVQVATGSGIGVFMSFVLQRTRTDVHVIWIARSIRESFGDEIWQAVNDALPDVITVIDTAVSGRPKTVELVVRKAIEWRAEVVIVTSNPSGTNQIVNGCKSVGIPAFGPIWDS